MTMFNPQSREFFEAKYRATEDPWHFASSGYEHQRYQATLDTLSRARYRRAFEPGCSIGVLTAALAQRVEQLVACDISDAAVATARYRCRELVNVEIHQADVTVAPRKGPYDLIVFSELGYYFSAETLKKISHELSNELEVGGEFVAVHWLGSSTDHVLHGDEVHDVLAQTFRGEWRGGSRHTEFRIDSWWRTP